jgi:5' nucleotidase, deoxy (Pyrimidine), cytosolic type C protein (NT5C)
MIQCYIDLDGVMVDLYNGLQNKLNFTFPKEQSPENTKRIHATWDKIAKEYPTFWFDLDPLPYYKELYEQIRSICPAPLILSATPEPYVGDDDMNCRNQKISWVYKHLGAPQAMRAIITKSKLKQNFIDPKLGMNVLIDDHLGNIARWYAAGGVGIHHTDIETTLKKLQELK